MILNHISSHFYDKFVLFLKTQGRIQSKPPPDIHNQTAVRCIHFPMYLSAADSTPIQNRISCVNVISEGSPILIRSVRRISFGMTIRPRSSIRLTIPVAFILLFSPISKLFAEYCCRYCLQVQENYANAVLVQEAAGIFRQSNAACFSVF